MIRLVNEENKHRCIYLKKSHRVRELYVHWETIAFILDRGNRDGAFLPEPESATVYLTFSSLCYHISNQYTLEIALGLDLKSATAQEQRLNRFVEVAMAHCLRRTTASCQLRSPEAFWRPEGDAAGLIDA